MTIAHEIRGRLHAMRMQLTFMERALVKPGCDPEVLEAARAAGDELAQLERLVLTMLVPTAVY